MARLTRGEKSLILDAALQIVNALEVDGTEPPDSHCYVTVNVDKVCFGFTKADYEKIKKAITKIN